VIPIEENVEKGSFVFVPFVSRSKDMNADHIILDINTPGGLVDAICLIWPIRYDNSDIPVTAYVNRRACPQVLIALQCRHIYMAPGGKMGAAAIIDTQGNAADQKARNHCGWLKWKMPQ
jgi:membrane-bound serine protease (ClpP class)